MIELKALPMHWKGNNLGIKIQICRAIFVSSYIPFLRNVAKVYLKKKKKSGAEASNVGIKVLHVYTFSLSVFLMEKLISKTALFAMGSMAHIGCWVR